MRKYEVTDGTGAYAYVEAESAWAACVIVSNKSGIAMSDLNAHAVK